MKEGYSLRWRLVFGAALWTAGLVIVINYLSLALVQAHRIGRVGLHYSAMFVLGVGALITALWQVQRGVSSLRRLRSDLMSVREGAAPRVDGRYPAEVQPVVDDLNALLEHRERAVSRAVAKAGDLAHGLKTPLAILEQEAERADAAGHHDLAAVISEQVDRMQRQVDYHLAQARAAASGAAAGARSGVRESAEGLVRALLRLHADRGLTIDVNATADLTVRTTREDLDEMLGNLLDNACKWTRSRVVVTAVRRNAIVAIAVEDNGPGVAPELRGHVLRRGARADEAAPGSGFGLAIVRDLAELYGGAIVLETSTMGGLRAELTLPV